jgi:hypothetical protein
VYATVTDSPDATADAKVNTTVEPDTAADDTVTAEPFANTAYAPIAAVVADSASEYVSVTVVPAVFVAADTNVGSRASITSALFRPSDPTAPGLGRSREFNTGDVSVPVNAETDA